MAGKGSKRTIDAGPVKDLFIAMLVRDIELRHAIIDLVDNSVDGARRAKSRKRTKSSAAQGRGFEGYYLNIEVDDQEVSLEDNCGGITLSDAEEYAFRFGRPHTVKGVNHSVGKFGVGMKRAFFKLGKTIDLTSTTRTSHFHLKLDVDKWRKKKAWQFKLDEVETNKRQSKDRIGTLIQVTDLLPAVAKETGQSSFPHNLLDELTYRHREAINEGFTLLVNGIKAQATDFTLLASSELVPYYQEYQHANGGAPVRVRIACGIENNLGDAAGWDIVCNGRTVLKSDRTTTTGWHAGDETFIPAYHGQFSRFRGMATFDSTDAGRVPWTTTKTKIDQDSAVWREAKEKMILAMRPVIDFLNAVDRELNQEGSESEGHVLAVAIEKADPNPLGELKPNRVFKYPSERKAPQLSRVSFARPKVMVDQAKAALEVGTNREVGEEAFDYWIEAELDLED